MKVAASRRHHVIGALMVVAAPAYLVPFVPRGWIPHDEGMLGQSADWVLHGGLPHIDYEEAYTGGLSWLYAAVFKVGGVDLVNVRWLLWIAASVATWLVYTIARRYLEPRGAALAAWVALGWSFPNYFAGLPSWWLLICALACVWAVIRHVETGQWRFLVAAGAAAGTALAIKQTGVYLLIALVLSLLHDGGAPSAASPWMARVEQLIKWGAAAAAIMLAGIILAPRILHAEGVYLFVPVFACAAVLFLPLERSSPPPSARSPVTLLMVAAAAAALPIVTVLIPYLARHRVWDFVYGSVILPQRRLAFASAAMPGASLIITGVPLLALVFPAARSGVDSGAFSLAAGWRVLRGLLWLAALSLPFLALWNVTSYQLIWQSSRALAALLPLGVCWRLASRQILNRDQRRIAFVSAAVLAWMSLNQFPFAAPIYFSYVTPLAVVATIGAADATSRLRRDTMVPWAVMLVLFALLSTNRAYIESLGVFHAPQRFDTSLGLPRAHLKISKGDAQLYRYLVFSIKSHLGGGQLIAGPDCPEVYFLSGLRNPSGKLFDFLSDDPARRPEDDEVPWLKGDVIVLNHAPHFSPAPSEALLSKLRHKFPYGEEIGRFELRWR